MAAVVWAAGLEDRGVAVVGSIPAKLPSFELPKLDWSHVRALAGSSLAIALLGLLEAIAMAKAIAAQTGQKLDINQQCLSEGLANLTGSLFHCYPGSGSLTRSTINQQAGAQTQWSGVICAAAVALTVLLFGPLASYIPRSALAGILMLAAWRLVDRQQLAYHLRTTRSDAWIVCSNGHFGRRHLRRILHSDRRVFVLPVLRSPGGPHSHDRAGSRPRASSPRTHFLRSAVRSYPHFQSGGRILLRCGP